MRGRVTAAAIALAIGASAAQGEPTALDPSVLIVEFPRGAPFFALPDLCPGSLPDADPAEEICFAELYQGRIRVLRHLSGPRLARGAIMRLTAHARRWGPGTRMLVAASPFRDGESAGHYAFWWHSPEANGDFCVASDELARWDDNSLRRVFAAGRLRHFRARGYRERRDFRCIRGPSANR